MNQSLRKALVREIKETFLSDIHLSKTLIPKTCPQTQLAGGGPLRGCSWTIWGRSKQAIHHPKATELKAWEMRRLDQKNQYREGTRKPDMPLSIRAPSSNWNLCASPIKSWKKRENPNLTAYYPLSYHVPLQHCNEIGINFAVVQTLDFQSCFKLHLPRLLPLGITCLSLSSPAQLPIFIIPQAGPNCHGPCSVTHGRCTETMLCAYQTCWWAPNLLGTQPSHISQPLPQSEENIWLVLVSGMWVDKMLPLPGLAPKMSCTITHITCQVSRDQLDFNTHSNIRSKDGGASVSLSLKELCSTKSPSANSRWAILWARNKFLFLLFLFLKRWDCLLPVSLLCHRNWGSPIT